MDMDILNHTYTTLTNCLMTQANKKASSNTPQIVLPKMAYIITYPHSNNDLLIGKRIVISLAKSLANILVCIILVSNVILQYLQFTYDYVLDS